MLDNKPNQPTKFRTKLWVEINDESRGKYNTNSQVKFKTSMLRSSLCDCSDAYTLVSRTITTTGSRNDNAARRLDERNKGVKLKCTIHWLHKWNKWYSNRECKIYRFCNAYVYFNWI